MTNVTILSLYGNDIRLVDEDAFKPLLQDMAIQGSGLINLHGMIIITPLVNHPTLNRLLSFPYYVTASKFVKEQNIQPLISTTNRSSFFTPASTNTLVSPTANPLDCGCDMAWLVMNSTFLARVKGTCRLDGTIVSDLDPITFEEMCFKGFEDSS